MVINDAWFNVQSEQALVKYTADAESGQTQSGVRGVILPSNGTERSVVNRGCFLWYHKPI